MMEASKEGLAVKLADNEDGGRGDTGREVAWLTACSNGVPFAVGVPGLEK